MSPAILKRCVLAETAPTFLVNILVFTFILLMARIMTLANLVISNGAATWDIVWIFVLILPKSLSMSIPIAALLATLTTFLRMSADSEIKVIKASGISLFQLLPPILWFGLAALVLTGFFTVYLAPIANRQFRAELLDLAKARADLAIREQVFVRDFPGLTIYVGQLPLQADLMKNVVINDRRSPGENTFIVAEEGLLDVDREGGLLLFRLQNGVIDRIYESKNSVDSIFFDTYELKIFPGAEFENEENSLVLGRAELPGGELLAEAARARAVGFPGWMDYVMEYHRRLSFPVAAFLMAVIGAPLGASFRTRGRNFGLVVGLLVFLLYYSAYSLGLSLGGGGYVPPGPAIWAADVLALAMALFLLKGLNRSAPIDLGASFRRLRARFYAKNGPKFRAEA
ncbi:MAG: LptF/LptG family permease [Deltaproteobacteria bacterium]|jgi:lipopolysaccharide export system permease protein|nr:LptF/LptG family permease [Deltaproteobacteria bacterium]